MLQFGKWFCVALVMVVPITLTGQTMSPNTGAGHPLDALDASREMLTTFPVARALNVMPPVPAAGAVRREDGTGATVPLTATFAVVDLRDYEARLLSLYPPSSDVYPTDSLASARVARARAWIERLRAAAASPTAMERAGISGWQSIAFAQVAARAGYDTLARQLIDARLATFESSSAERSYVLVEAVAVFADQTQDSARLTRNLPLAERYANQLHAMPVGGYHTMHDSLVVLSRQLDAEALFRDAYATLGAGSQVLLHARRALALLSRIGVNRRDDVLDDIYRRTAFALAGLPDGGVFVDSLGILARAAVRSPNMTWPSRMPDAERMARMQRSVRVVEEEIADIQSKLASIHMLAPPIPAHAWLNTVDAHYRAIPHVRGLSDGIVRVLLFCGLDCTQAWPVLDRIQRMETSPGVPRVQGILVTTTHGAVGPDLAEPAAEVAWLQSYYVLKRHFTMPIAIWAGSKGPAELPEGTVGMRPATSPLDTSTYQRGWASFAIIDSHGNIRAWLDVNTRPQEALLRRRLASILAESPLVH